MRSGLVILTALVALVVVAAPATGRTFGDPDDVAGRLDLLYVSFSRTGTGTTTTLHFRATMYGEWTIRQCAHAATLEDGCTIKTVLDTTGPPAWRPTRRGVDYYLVWRPKSCALIDPSTLSLVGLGVAAKEGRAAVCSIRRNKLTIDKKIRWYTSTTWANVQTGTYASDSAPNTGWFG